MCGIDLLLIGVRRDLLLTGLRIDLPLTDDASDQWLTIV